MPLEARAWCAEAGSQLPASSSFSPALSSSECYYETAWLISRPNPASESQTQSITTSVYVRVTFFTCCEQLEHSTSEVEHSSHFFLCAAS